MFSNVCGLYAGLLAIGIMFCTPAWSQEEAELQSLISRGRYLAQAGDCMACHRGREEHDRPFVGGYIIESPMGNIVASNITPSLGTGIGQYSEADFKQALTQGVRKDGELLYPAMPYTAYQGLKDDDIHALYTYFMKGVEPVERPTEPTRLAFPFNVRATLKVWNWLFLNHPAGQTDVSLEPGLERGRYLVDTLGHCSACHSPRNWLMAEDAAAYLGGGLVGGWEAPNITSDETHGIGGWSQAELVQYLRSGHVNGKGQAAGGMAEAVENSLRHLDDADLNSIAVYLKQVPALATGTAHKAAYGYSGTSTPEQPSRYPEGQALYERGCASCHRLSGQGAYGGFFPSLTHNSTVGSEHFNNLVMVILHGVERQNHNLRVSMPGFSERLDDQQIAEISQYIGERFGRPDMQVSAADVALLRQGGKPPLLITLMPYLIGGAIIVLVVIAFWIVLSRRRRSNLSSAAVKHP